MVPLKPVGCLLSLQDTKGMIRWWGWGWIFPAGHREEPYLISSPGAQQKLLALSPLALGQEEESGDWPPL